MSSEEELRRAITLPADRLRPEFAAALGTVSAELMRDVPLKREQCPAAPPPPRRRRRRRAAAPPPSQWRATARIPHR